MTEIVLILALVAMTEIMRAHALARVLTAAAQGVFVITVFVSQILIPAKKLINLAMLVTLAA
jgi:hypothetical protein